MSNANWVIGQNNSQSKKDNSTLNKVVAWFYAKNWKVPVKKINIELDNEARYYYIQEKGSSKEWYVLDKKEMLESVKEVLDSENIEYVDISEDEVVLKIWDLPTISVGLATMMSYALWDDYELREAKPHEFPDVDINK